MINAVEMNKDYSTREKASYTFIALFFYAVMITDIVRQVFLLFDIVSNETFVEMIRNMLYVIIFAGYYLSATRKTRLKALLVGILFVLFLMISLLLNPKLSTFLVTLSLIFLSRNLLAFVMISELKHPVFLVRIITDLSWITILYVLLQILTPKDASSGYAYNTSFSYNILLPAVACFYSYFILKERRGISAVVVLFSFFGMVAYGARGAIICASVAVFYMVLMKRNEYSSKKLFGLIALVVIIAVVLLLKDSILSFLAKLAPQSRTIYLIRTNNFIWYANRENYYYLARVFFRESPFRVTGIAGDVFFFAEQLGVSIELGRHSHNMFLELLVSYGVVIGGIAVCVVTYQLYRFFLRVKLRPEMRTICACIIIPLLPFIFISGSLCQSYQYWFVIGGVFSIYNRKAYKPVAV